jgi:hypothetical protein
MDQVYFYYNDADDRTLVELDEEMEIEYLNGELLLNEDIKLPIFIINGVPYYD